MHVQESSSSWDVAVVGAGPGGALCARELAEAGVRTCLLEKEALPRYKTCGGGVVGRARRLSRLELGEVVETVFTSSALELSASGQRYVVERTEPLVTMTMRADFDAALVREAERAGAEIRAARAVRGLAMRAEEVRLDAEGGAVRARYVVAADGALGPVAGWAGLTERPNLIPALEWELWPDDSARPVEPPVFDFDATARGYAWVFPKREHLSVGILSTRRGAKGLPGELERWLAGRGLWPAARVERHGFQIPIAPRPGGFGRGRVLVVGDAAGLADPITCEGISHALLSGSLAARAILRHMDEPRAAQSEYRRSLRREVLGELRTARLLAKLVYGSSRWRARLFRRSGQALAEAMAEVIAGRSTYRELAWRPRNWWRGLARRAQPSSLA